MLTRNLSPIFIAVVIATVSGAADTPPTARPIRIVRVGDSTVASYAEPPKDRPDLTGWGQVFGEFERLADGGPVPRRIVVTLLGDDRVYPWVFDMEFSVVRLVRHVRPVSQRPEGGPILSRQG